MIDSGGLQGELIGHFTSNCVGGETSTTFRVCRKSTGQKKWTTHVVVQKCVDALDNLTVETFEQHLMELETKIGKWKREKPERYSRTW